MFPIAISGNSIASKPFLTRLRTAGWPVSDLNGGDDPADTRVLFFLPHDLMESERLLFEEETFAKSLPALETIVISATLSPRYVRALRGRVRRSVTLIDAPVIGAARLADGGSCSFLLGGPREALDGLQPLFDLLGQSAARMGDFGTAMAAKALQDCLAAASSAITRSALDWAEAQGIEENRMLPFLEATFGPRLPDTTVNPAMLIHNALPGDNAGEMLARRVESALGSALKGVHLTPPRAMDTAPEVARLRSLH